MEEIKPEPPADEMIDRKQLRLDALDAKTDKLINVKADAGESAEDDPTETYLEKVDAIQGRIARMRARAAAMRNGRMPRWKRLDTFCKETEEKLLTEIEKVNRESLFKGIAAFNATITEIHAKFIHDEIWDDVEKSSASVKALLTAWGCPETDRADAEAKLAKNGYSEKDIQTLQASFSLLERLSPNEQQLCFGGSIDRLQAVGIMRNIPKANLREQSGPARSLALLLAGGLENVETQYDRLKENVTKEQQSLDALLVKQKAQIQLVVEHLRAKDWKGQQADVVALQDLEKLIIAQREKLNAARGVKLVNENALMQYDAAKAVAEGRETEADRLLLHALERYGEDLQKLDPQLHSEAVKAKERQLPNLSGFEQTLFDDKRNDRALTIALQSRLRRTQGLISLLNQSTDMLYRVGLSSDKVPIRTLNIDESLSPEPLRKQLTPRENERKTVATFFRIPISDVRFTDEEKAPEEFSAPYLLESSKETLYGTQRAYGIAMPRENEGNSFVGLSDGSIVDSKNPRIRMLRYVEMATGEKLPVYLSPEAATLLEKGMGVYKPVLKHEPTVHRAFNGEKIRILTKEDLALTNVNTSGQFDVLTFEDGKMKRTVTGIDQIRRREEEDAQDVFRAFDRDPAIKYITAKVAPMGEGLGELQTIFQTMMDPKQKVSKSPELLRFMREKAQKPLGAIKEAFNDPALLPNLKEARAKIEQLRAFSNDNISRSSWDYEIFERMQAIDGMIDLLENKNGVRSMLETIIDKSILFDDSWANWLKTEGPKVLAAIAVATAAAISIAMTLGAAAPLWAVAAAMAAGGIVGYELESEAVYDRMQTDEEVKNGKARFTARSRLGKYLAGQKEFNAETGLEEAMTFWGDTAGPYALQFATDFLMAWATLGMSKWAAGRISAWAQDSAMIQNMLKSGTLQRMTGRLGRIKVTLDSLSEKGMAQQFARQIVEQVGQDAAMRSMEPALSKLDGKMGVAGAIAGLGLGIVMGVRLRPHGAIVTIPHGVNRQEVRLKLIEQLKAEGHGAEAHGEDLVKVKMWNGENMDITLDQQMVEIFDLAKSRDTGTLKEQLKSNPIDDLTRVSLASDLLGRTIPKETADAILAAHAKPGAVDEGNMTKNIFKEGPIYDALRTEYEKTMPVDQAHERAINETKMILDAGIAGTILPPPPPPPPRRLKNAISESPPAPSLWKEGRNVVIQTDGRLDPGWRVSVDHTDGSFTVIKVVNPELGIRSKILTKRVNTDDLQRWNPDGPKDPWKTGTETRVLRSDGTLENEWKVLYGNADGTYTLGKGTLIKRGITVTDLDAWNSPAFGTARESPPPEVKKPVSWQEGQKGKVQLPDGRMDDGWTVLAASLVKVRSTDANGSALVRYVPVNELRSWNTKAVFDEGARVTVKRTGGQMENNWRVEGPDYVALTKEGQKHAVFATSKELGEWNSVSLFGHRNVLPASPPSPVTKVSDKERSDYFKQSFTGSQRLALADAERRSMVYDIGGEKAHVIWIKNGKSSVLSGINPDSVTGKYLNAPEGSPEHALLLDAEQMLMQAFSEAKDLIPHTNNTFAGFVILRQGNDTGLTNGVGGNLGIGVNSLNSDSLFTALAEAKKTGNYQRVQDECSWMKGGFAHEMTHGGRGKMDDHPHMQANEVPSHAIQFLSTWNQNQKFFNTRISLLRMNAAPPQPTRLHAELGGLKLIETKLQENAHCIVKPANMSPAELSKSIASIPADIRKEVLRSIASDIMRTPVIDFDQYVLAVHKNRKS